MSAVAVEIGRRSTSGQTVRRACPRNCIEFAEHVQVEGVLRSRCDDLEFEQARAARLVQMERVNKTNILSGVNGLDILFENNKRWAAALKESDPDFFDRLAEQQQPEYLWIGCSDSRVPANQIIGLMPGEVFVHRNVANLVVHTDLNCLSVLQFAISVLKVKHVIVCGHYGCGGIEAVVRNLTIGLCDNWLRNAREIFLRNERELAGLADDPARQDRLCEMNVAAQVKNVCDTTVVRAAWQRGQELHIHGVIYSIRNGILRNLTEGVSSAREADSFEGA